MRWRFFVCCLAELVQHRKPLSMLHKVFVWRALLLNMPFHCSHSTQANGNCRCVFYVDASYKSSEIAVSDNLKTCVPSLPACFEFSLVMRPSKIRFIETLHPSLLVRGGNLKFFISPSFCKLPAGVYFVPCCCLVTFWMAGKQLNGLIYSHFKTNLSQNQSVFICHSTEENCVSVAIWMDSIQISIIIKLFSSFDFLLACSVFLV